MKRKLSILTALAVLIVSVLAVPAVSYAANVKLNKTSVTLYKGAVTTLKVSGTSEKVSWSSNSKSIATVNSAGKITAKKPGKTTIKAKVSGKTYKCKVSVKKMKTSSSAAKKAFKKYLDKSISKKWSKYSKFSNSNFKFVCIDLGSGKNKVPTMFVWNSASAHFEGYVGVYQYIGGKVKCINKNDWISSVYPSTGTVLTCYQGGGYGETHTWYYSTLNKKTSAKNKAYTIILRESSFDDENEYEWCREQFGNDVYKIGGSRVSKSKFDSYCSSTLKRSSSVISNKALRSNRLKNTKANRNSYFK